MVHAFNENGPATVVDDCHDASQMMALGLRLGRRDHLARCRQGQHFFLHELRCRILRQERERVQRELDGLRGSHGDDGELSDVDQHTADAGTETFEEERDQSLINRLEYELQAIERAEKRLEDGSYGLSVDSGVPIPDERLEAVPHAERTVEEQARVETQERNAGRFMCKLSASATRLIMSSLSGFAPMMLRICQNCP